LFQIGGPAGRAVGDTTSNVGKTLSSTTTGLGKTGNNSLCVSFLGWYTYNLMQWVILLEQSAGAT